MEIGEPLATIHQMFQPIVVFRAEIIEITFVTTTSVSLGEGSSRDTVMSPHWTNGEMEDVKDGNFFSKRPAVYLTSETSKVAEIKVRVVMSENITGNAHLQGNLGPISFDGQGEMPTSVGEHLVQVEIMGLPKGLQWVCGDAVWHASIPSMHRDFDLLSQTRLEFFALLDTPPATIYQSGVWVEALRFLFDKAMVRHIERKVDAASRVVGHCHSSPEVLYDSYKGKSHFGVEHNGGCFKLSDYLDGYSSICRFVNCYDQAGAVQSLCAALGVSLTWRFLEPFGHILPTNLVGVGVCNNPFFLRTGTPPMIDPMDPRRIPFGNHAFCSILISDLRALDACAGPHLGNEPFVEYMMASIDMQPGIYIPPKVPGRFSDISRERGVNGVR